MNYIGQILCERYTITTEIGRGGMGTVYLAQDNRLNGFWAVKRVDTTQYERMAFFMKEVELLTGLDYPTIPRIVDRVEIGKDFFVVMDLINGTPLNKKLEVEGPQKEENVIQWAKEVCKTLDYLHTVSRNPIVYRDMKPHNLMLVTGTNQIKLVDFGIAKECVRNVPHKEQSVGTKGYAAPEQYKNGSHIYDERTDIYSLGCTLYTLVTGAVPEMPPNTVKSIRETNPFLSEGLEHIINKCTQINPEERYRNCKEVLRDLDNIELLTSSYKRMMSIKLGVFVGCMVLSLLSLTMSLWGRAGLNREKSQNYDTYYNNALSYQLQGNIPSAEQAYIEAIINNPKEVNTYVRLLNMLSDESNNNLSAVENTKYAVDLLRKYVESKEYAVYQEPILLLEIAKRCIDTNDSAYAQIAVDYFELIKDSRAYKKGEINPTDVENMEIMALSKARDFSTQDFKKFGKALLSLEEYVKNGEMSVTERLDYYYRLILMYSNYPMNIEDAYDKILELGEEAKQLIDGNVDENMSFNKIIPLYETVASNLYDYSVMQSENEKKKEILQQSITWFNYLEELDYQLTEALALKKGNVYRAMFDAYCSTQKINVGDEARAYLIKAEEIFQSLLDNNPDYFMAAINLTQTEIELQLSQPSSRQEFSKVIDYYGRVERIKNANKNLSNMSLSRFSALKKQMDGLSTSKSTNAAEMGDTTNE